MWAGNHKLDRAKRRMHCVVLNCKCKGHIDIPSWIKMKIYRQRFKCVHICGWVLESMPVHVCACICGVCMYVWLWLDSLFFPWSKTGNPRATSTTRLGFWFPSVFFSNISNQDYLRNSSFQEKYRWLWNILLCLKRIRNVLKNIKANWKRFLWKTGKAKQTGNTMISLSLIEINTKFIVWWRIGMKKMQNTFP